MDIPKSGSLLIGHCLGACAARDEAIPLDTLSQSEESGRDRLLGSIFFILIVTSGFFVTCKM